MGFPRDHPQNQHANTRHDIVPGSATEASIEISPDYDPPISQADLTALSNLSPAFSDADHATLAQFKFTGSDTGFDQRVPADLTCKSGFYLRLCVGRWTFRYILTV